MRGPTILLPNGISASSHVKKKSEPGKDKKIINNENKRVKRRVNIKRPVIVPMGQAQCTGCKRVDISSIGSCRKNYEKNLHT